MKQKMKSWVANVQSAGLDPITVGTFEAESRQLAKIEARKFVFKHFPSSSTKINWIQEGKIILTTHGEQISMENEIEGNENESISTDQE